MSKEGLQDEQLKGILKGAFLGSHANYIEYSKRLQATVLNEKRIKESIALTTFILIACQSIISAHSNSEQVNRILVNSMNIEKLRSNTSLDSISLPHPAIQSQSHENSHKSFMTHRISQISPQIMAFLNEINLSFNSLLSSLHYKKRII